MKKLISLVLVALLLCTLTVTALANDSVLPPAALQPAPASSQTVDSVIVPASSTSDTDPVKAIINKINNDDAVVTVSDLLKALANTDPEINEKAIAAGLTDEAAIASKASEVKEDEVEGEATDEDGKKVKQYKLNYNISKEDIDKFVVMCIAPSGQAIFVPLQVTDEGINFVKVPNDFPVPFFAVLIKK